MSKAAPSMDAWLAEAKSAPDAEKVGMYLVHNGIVRKTAKAKVRRGEDAPDVDRMYFSSDREKVDAAIEEARKMEGIYYIRAWLNEQLDVLICVFRDCAQDIVGRKVTCD
jgi:hypothetical protein